MRNPTLDVLFRTLEALGVKMSIHTLSDRKRVQKAVYLAQAAGVPLGYRFGWYILGPYCPALTQDYYALADELAQGERVAVGAALTASVASRLQTVGEVVRQVPSDVRLGQPEWLELVASIDYLAREWKLPMPQIEDTLRTKKPHLVDFFDQATRGLLRSGLWEAKK